MRDCTCNIRWGGWRHKPCDIIFFQGLLLDGICCFISNRICLVYAALPQSKLFGAVGSELSKVERHAVDATAAAGKLAEPTIASCDENLLDWVKNDERRMLHVVYCVGNLEKTIKYAI